jgi:hypothetical protein
VRQRAAEFGLTAESRNRQQRSYADVKLKKPHRVHDEGVSAPMEGGVNMKQNNRLTGRRIGAAAVLAAVTTFGGVALAPAAFADSTVASTTTSSTAHSATHSAVVRPATANQCYQWLNFYDYTVTVPRGVACNVAAHNFPTHAIALTACIAAMGATGVIPPVAIIVCSIASVPG